MRSLTWYTLISSFQVCFEVLWAIINTIEHLIRNSQFAFLLTGALSIHVSDNVLCTAHVAIVSFHTSSESHPAILGMCDGNDMVLWAGCMESLCLTKLIKLWNKIAAH